MGRNDNRSALLRQWELLKMIPSRGEGITSAQMTEKLTKQPPAKAGGFELVRPAGRTYLEVEVLYTPGKGKC